jgi:SAM-dependent methyltransferase
MNFSQKLSKKVSDVYHSYSPILLPASRLKVECPFCGWKGTSFLPNGVDARPNARCPKCNSLERHRLYYLYLKKVIPADRPVKVLHFAPEKILSNLFRSFPKVEYLSADLNPAKAMVKQDITAITYPDASFDIIFCSHVLEHIPDDLLAMRELRRVLKPGGFALLQVPVKDHFNGRVIEKTYEDFTITDPKGRQQAFGQFDHVRVYGRDFKDRLEKSGFQVSVEKFAESLSPALLQRYALLPQGVTATETEGWIYHCR